MIYRSSKVNLSGFSLIEVMLVIVLLSLLAAISLSSNPISSQNQEKQALSSSQKALANAILMARQLAVSSEQSVWFCANDNCEDNWSRSWVIINADGVVRRGQTDAVVQIVWKGFPVQKKFINFWRNGLSGYQNGTFYLCSTAYTAAIILNQSGRFYLSTISEKSSDSVC